MKNSKKIILLILSTLFSIQSYASENYNTYYLDTIDKVNPGLLEVKNSNNINIDKAKAEQIKIQEYISMLQSKKDDLERKINDNEKKMSTLEININNIKNDINKIKNSSYISLYDEKKYETVVYTTEEQQKIKLVKYKTIQGDTWKLITQKTYANNEKIYKDLNLRMSTLKNINDGYSDIKIFNGNEDIYIPMFK